MSLTSFLAMVRKDLQLFFSDRRSVIVTFAVPIIIGAFIGSLTSGGGNNGESAKIKVAVVDLDGSAVSKRIIKGAQGDKNLAITLTTEAGARAQVQKGAISAAVIIPMRFGDQAGRAFFNGGQQKPELQMLSDPSRAFELGMVRGILTEHVMESVSSEMFSGQSGRKFVDEALANVDSFGMPADQKRLLKEMLKGVQHFYNDSTIAPSTSGGRAVFSMPYAVREEQVTSGDNVPYNGYAHSFAGMGIQFLLFAMLNLGVEMLLERQRGLWKRLRSAPVSRYTLLGAKATSGTIISMMTLLVSFGFAMLMFRVRIQGSVLGFLLVAVTCSLMAATFGLMIAAVGRTPGTARGVSSLVVLVMVMVGGAWIPTFVFPKWMQQLTVVVPVRWAVDGLDATTWRGLGLSSALAPAAALVGFAVLFALVAVTRFRWEEA